MGPGILQLHALPSIEKLRLMLFLSVQLRTAIEKTILSTNPFNIVYIFREMNMVYIIKSKIELLEMAKTDFCQLKFIPRIERTDRVFVQVFTVLL